MSSINTTAVPDSDSLVWGERIGEGGIGEVFAGTLNNIKIAIKRFHSSVNHSTVTKEVTICKALAHRHITRFYALSPPGSEPALLISEWAENGPVDTYLEAHPDADRTRLAYQIALGMEYLHSAGIIHGNLKPSNVLVALDGRALLADFGLSKVRQQALTAANASESVATRHAGTPHYIAPECWRGRFSKPGDVYSFAMTCLAIFSDAAPWGVCDPDTIRLLVLGGHRPSHPDDPDPLAPNLTGAMWELITQAWVANPTERPTFTDILDCRTFEHVSMVEEAHPASRSRSPTAGVPGLDLDDEEDEIDSDNEWPDSMSEACSWHPACADTPRRTRTRSRSRSPPTRLHSPERKNTSELELVPPLSDGLVSPARARDEAPDLVVEVRDGSPLEPSVVVQRTGCCGYASLSVW